MQIISTLYSSNIYKNQTTKVSIYNFLTILRLKDALTTKTRLIIKNHYNNYPGSQWGPSKTLEKLKKPGSRILAGPQRDLRKTEKPRPRSLMGPQWDPTKTEKLRAGTLVGPKKQFKFNVSGGLFINFTNAFHLLHKLSG